MPTYQYACTECSHSFEQVQSFADDALTVCPVCQGRLRKVYNAVGVVFKGSGFYRNDSRAPEKSGGSETSEKTSDSGSEKSGTKSDTGTKTDSGSSTKTDSKPASGSGSSGSASSGSSSSGTAASSA